MFLWGMHRKEMIRSSKEVSSISSMYFQATWNEGEKAERNRTGQQWKFWRSPLLKKKRLSIVHIHIHSDIRQRTPFTKVPGENLATLENKATNTKRIP